jgi:hypothetical protein
VARGVWRAEVPTERGGAAVQGGCGARRGDARREEMKPRREGGDAGRRWRGEEEARGGGRGFKISAA